MKDTHFWYPSVVAFTPDAPLERAPSEGFGFFYDPTEKVIYVYFIIVNLHEFKLFIHIHAGRKISMDCTKL